MNTESDPRAEALAFLQANNAGVVATVSREQQPRAAAVHYIVDDSFNVYFLTKTTSRKYAAIQAHPQVAFVVGHSDIPQTIQIEGLASEITDAAEKEAHGSALMQVLAQKQPGFVPIGKLDGDLALIWIQPKWLRWADYSKAALGQSNLFHEITF